MKVQNAWITNANVPRCTLKPKEPQGFWRKGTLKTQEESALAHPRAALICISDAETFLNVLMKLHGLSCSLTLSKDPADSFEHPPPPRPLLSLSFTSSVSSKTDPPRSPSHYVCLCSFLCRLVPAPCRKCQHVLTQTAGLAAPFLS